MRQSFDVVIVGGSESGRAAALAANPAKQRVALVDEFGASGANNYAGGMVEAFVEAAKGGDFELAVASARSYRQEFQAQQPHKRQLQAAGIAVITGHAKPLDDQSITVGRDVIEARRIAWYIAHQDVLPDIAGVNYFKSYLDLFDLAKPPGRLVFVQTSAISHSLAKACRVLGVAVSLIEPSSHLKLGSIQHLQRSYRLHYLEDDRPQTATAELIIFG